VRKVTCRASLMDASEQLATGPMATQSEAAPAPAPAPAPEGPSATTTAEAPQPGATPEGGDPAAPAPVPAPEKVQEEPEPQNALTERFTTQEWVSLKEFRVRHLESLHTPSHPFPYRPPSQTYWRKPSPMIPKQKRHLSPCGVSRSTLPIPVMPKSA
jgi:hypothetical protein